MATSLATSSAVGPLRPAVGFEVTFDVGDHRVLTVDAPVQGRVVSLDRDGGDAIATNGPLHDAALAIVGRS